MGQAICSSPSFHNTYPTKENKLFVTTRFIPTKRAKADVKNTPYHRLVNNFKRDSHEWQGSVIAGLITIQSGWQL